VLCFSDSALACLVRALRPLSPKERSQMAKREDCLWFRGGSLQNSRSMGPRRSINFHESNHRVTQLGN
jgi:hypothetical protein